MDHGRREEAERHLGRFRQTRWEDDYTEEKQVDCDYWLNAYLSQKLNCTEQVMARRPKQC